MKFNAAVKAEKAEAFRYFMRLANKQQLIEVKRISPSRSLSQNNYLHLLIGAFGAHFGYDMQESKTIYKREANPAIYVYEKNGQKFLRSSADLSKEEMQISIDRFRQYSAENGLELPLATDQGWLQAIENEIERSRYYM